MYIRPPYVPLYIYVFICAYTHVLHIVFVLCLRIVLSLVGFLISGLIISASFSFSWFPYRIRFLTHTRYLRAAAPAHSPQTGHKCKRLPGPRTIGLKRMLTC